VQSQKRLVLVIDKGCTSKDVITKVKDKIGIVSSLKRSDVPELMKLSLAHYSKLYTNAKENTIMGYRTRKKIFGNVFTVVVAYNKESKKKQIESYEKAKNRFLAEIDKILVSISKPHKGPKLTQESIRNRLSDSIPKKWRSVFKFHVGNTLDKKIDVKAWVVKKKEKEFYRGFGKTIIFTDRHDMPTKDIVKTYMSLWTVEEDFKFLKDRVLIPVTPIYHHFGFTNKSSCVPVCYGTAIL